MCARPRRGQDEKREESHLIVGGPSGLLSHQSFMSSLPQRAVRSGCWCAPAQTVQALLPVPRASPQAFASAPSQMARRGHRFGFVGHWVRKASLQQLPSAASQFWRTWVR